jgi:hypothetical protein
MTLTTEQSSPNFDRVLGLVELFGDMVLLLMKQPERGPSQAKEDESPERKKRTRAEGANGVLPPTPMSVTDVNPAARYAAKQLLGILDCSLAKIRKDTRQGGPLPTVREGKRVYVLGADLIKHVTARLSPSHRSLTN